MIPGSLDAGPRLSSVQPLLYGARVGTICPTDGNSPSLSVLDRAVGAVSAWRARGRADAAERRSLSCLARLNDHTLRDIGLSRTNLYGALPLRRPFDV